MIKLKEKDIQKQILEYLQIKKVFHYRSNTGTFSNNKGGFYSFGAVGSPDIICVINGQYVGIEVKRPGGKMSENQLSFKNNLELAGGKYVLAYSLDDIVDMI